MKSKRPSKQRRPGQFAGAHGSDASASDSRPPEAKRSCMYGHPDTCDTLCKLWGCKFIQAKALTALRPNVRVSESGGDKPIT